jgi:hypothetical protein
VVVRLGGIEAPGLTAAHPIGSTAEPTVSPARLKTGFLSGCVGCYGQDAGGVTGREVLLADAANLSDCV